MKGLFHPLHPGVAIAHRRLTVFAHRIEVTPVSVLRPICLGGLRARLRPLGRLGTLLYWHPERSRRMRVAVYWRLVPPWRDCSQWISAIGRCADAPVCRPDVEQVSRTSSPARSGIGAINLAAVLRQIFKWGKLARGNASRPGPRLGLGPG